MGATGRVIRAPGRLLATEHSSAPRAVRGTTVQAVVTTLPLVQRGPPSQAMDPASLGIASRARMDTMLQRKDRHPAPLVPRDTTAVLPLWRRRRAWLGSSRAPARRRVPIVRMVITMPSRRRSFVSPVRRGMSVPIRQPSQANAHPGRTATAMLPCVRVAPRVTTARAREVHPSFAWKARTRSKTGPTAWCVLLATIA